MIGDSQWIGGGAENGHYVKLNDFLRCQRHHDGRLHSGDCHRLRRMAKEHTELLRASGLWRRGRLDIPQGLVRTPRASNRVHGNTAATRRPCILEELKDIAAFFQGRDIDGTTVYGAAIYTERGSEGITMGVPTRFTTIGFEYENPDKPYDLEGFVNSDGAIAGLEFYKQLYEAAHLRVRPTGTWAKTSTPTVPVRLRCR